jgi:hypothetical protein
MTEFFAEGGVSDTTNIYAASFYVALANIPGYMLAAKTIDGLGRKQTLILSMVLTGFSMFGILAVKGGNGVSVMHTAPLIANRGVAQRGYGGGGGGAMHMTLNMSHGRCVIRPHPQFHSHRHDQHHSYQCPNHIHHHNHPPPPPPQPP